MAKIKLDKDQEHGFELLLALSEESLILMIDSIEKVGEKTFPSNLPENLHQDMGISEEDLRKIISLIFSLHRSKQVSGYSSEKIVDDLLEALTETNNEKLTSEHCKEYLLKVMSIDRVSSTVNALNAAYSREKILLGTEIITDVRPIFEHNEFTDLLIIHNLKIEYGEPGKPRSAIYLALDRDDLSKLRDSIKNAESREEAIKSKLSSAGVTFINWESDD